MSARAVRRVVVAVFVLGVAGIIAFSISDEPDAALASGLLTAAAAVVLIAVTAVTTPRRTAESAARHGPLLVVGDGDGDPTVLRLVVAVGAAITVLRKRG